MIHNTLGGISKVLSAGLLSAQSAKIITLNFSIRSEFFFINSSLAIPMKPKFVVRYSNDITVKRLVRRSLRLSIFIHIPNAKRRCSFSKSFLVAIQLYWMYIGFRPNWTSIGAYSITTSSFNVHCSMSLVKTLKIGFDVKRGFKIPTLDKLCSIPFLTIRNAMYNFEPLSVCKSNPPYSVFLWVTQTGSKI